MSTGGRRRRRGGRKSSSLAGDPLDLFLDAITNALGVVMFILLMVVLFGRASDSQSETAAPTAVEVREARDLEEKRQQLQAKLAMQGNRRTINPVIKNGKTDLNLFSLPICNQCD